MIEDKFVASAPTNQHGVDCFPGLWYSKFPDAYEVQGGDCLVFDDSRLEWGMQHFEPTNQWDVLELGPLEGAHGYYMEKNTPVRSITAVEANRHCWVKCLITKEITDLRRTRFLLGNFVEFLKGSTKQYELCLAIGVLYHMKDPLELLRFISRATDRSFSGPSWPGKANCGMAARGGAGRGIQSQGYVNDYAGGEALGSYIGGIENYAVWLTRESLVAALGHYGFTHITFGHEGENQFGKEATLVAYKD